jgi:hypothetical protein
VLKKEKPHWGGLLQEPVMALLVVWLVIYFLVEVFRGVGSTRSSPAFAGTELAAMPEEDTPIPVEWELLPPVEQTADRN